MDQISGTERDYFILGFPLSDQAWHQYAIRSVLPDDLSGGLDNPAYEIRKLADRMTRDSVTGNVTPIHAEILLALRTLNQALRHVACQYFLNDNPGCLERARQHTSGRLGSEAVNLLYQVFVELFPPLAVKTANRTSREFLSDVDGPISGLDLSTVEMIMLFLTSANPAANSASTLFDDQELRRKVSFIPFVTELEDFIHDFEPAGQTGTSLFNLLRAPMLASPNSLFGQLQYIRDHWGHLLPDALIKRLSFALDVLKEIDVKRGGEPGPPPVLEFGPGSAGWDADYPEPEAFSRDADWMANVVLMAKSAYVWLDQLSRWYGRPIRTLADIPDEVLDQLARWGVSALWLIGLWERSDASRRVKQYMGNPEAVASAYSLREYNIAADLGGNEAYENLRHRAAERGIRLASDMVPNHMGIDSQWVIDHPDWFLQAAHPPYPAYNFGGGDLCEDPRVAIRIEDGYWTHNDAAVVFQRVDEHTGDVRYIYHGNDGTSMPWNDTAQLNFMLPEVREAVIQVILHVARMFPIIRFDAAMTLAKKHYQRLWFPAPGDAGAIPSRAEHGMSKADFDHVFPHEFWREVVDRVAAEAPDTLLLAEAFWLMEGYFVRTLGMHRVYNSAFMNMLKMEDNAKYRQTIKNVLEFSPPVLQRFVNFMNNPDEKTAVEQFGRGDKYFGCVLLLVTMPGLPMLGHGQIEGFSEKYGMEYQKAYWDEQIDEDLVRRHEHDIFPVMRRRHIFSGAENFALYDFLAGDGWVDENVFAYSNRHGDERALIIYNNAYDSTSGRVSLSSAINVGSADSPDLVRRSLSQALNLNSDENCWYIFRDYVDGLEYLRNGAELAGSGLHTDLHGYQYRALLDFREVFDRDGRWRRLAEDLRGGGRPNLDLALRRMEIAPALAELAALIQPKTLMALEPVDDLDDEPSPKESSKPKAAPKASPDKALSSDLAAYLHRLTATLQALPKLEVASPTAKNPNLPLAGLTDSLIPQAVYLSRILRRIPGPWSDLEDIQLAGTSLQPNDISLVIQEMEQALQDWVGHDYAYRRCLLLAQILAGASDTSTALRKGKIDWLAPALDNPDIRQFLGVNTHQDVDYLNQENLESFMLALLADTSIDEKGQLRKPTKLLLKTQTRILDKAHKTGYNVAQLKPKTRGTK